MRKLSCLLALIFTLAPAAVASAQSVENTYRGESNVLGEIGEVAEQPSQSTPTADAAAPSQAAPQPVVAQSGTLPFTGSEALLVALGGIALVGGGFALRRLSHN